MVMVDIDLQKITIIPNLINTITAMKQGNPYLVHDYDWSYILRAS